MPGTGEPVWLFPVITPAKSMMLAGFGSRTKPSEGTATELHAKALALKDSRGTRLVIVTTDLIRIPRPLRDRVEARVKERFQLPSASLLMNASHTHCGPELRMTKTALEELSEERQKLTIEYCRRLENALVKLVGDVLADCTPAQLSYSHARAGFAMNRRLKNPDPDGEPYLNHPNPDGPVDHDVPVLQVTWKDPARRAILFGYACHNTKLYVNQYAGDYAGFAQAFLERDQRGRPRCFSTGVGVTRMDFPGEPSNSLAVTAGRWPRPSKRPCRTARSPFVVRCRSPWNTSRLSTRPAHPGAARRLPLGPKNPHRSSRTN
ncbi:MAG: hypothetical protein CM1200mP2_16400 [Planctomycetaceae bacterium]|nr:MAG: hypothetical protein CM1200mP2_16400 [Planctomycetaceae bacterium]